MIRDREEAGRLLAQRLGAYCDDPDALILALPRGGVAVGYTLSLALHLPLDVLITRKLGAPGNPEYAMGALSETGAMFLNPDAERIINAGIWSRVHLADTIQAQRGEITRRQTLYRSGRPLPSLSDRSVLLVDDGVATGSTFLASIRALRGLNVQRLIAALPVGPVDTLSEISRTVDELVVLLAPEPFFAVGDHYVDFKQVEDEEVIRYLASAADGLRDRKHHAHA